MRRTSSWVWLLPIVGFVPFANSLQINVRGLLPRRLTRETSSSSTVDASTESSTEQGAATQRSKPVIEDLKFSYSRSLESHRNDFGHNQDDYYLDHGGDQVSQRQRRRRRRLWLFGNGNRRQTPKTLGKLIFVRCGQSEFNVNSTFSGWADPSLTDVGRQECEHAARLLLAEGYDVDVVYTSKLQRSIKSAWKILEQLDALFLPVYKTYRLNQRHYGSLQGLSKKITAESLGVDSVQAWRNSLKAKPPPLSTQDPSHPCHDRRYLDLPSHVIPDSESLLDCQDRARPLWTSSIRNDLLAGKTVLVVAHKDSIKGLIMEIDQLTNEQVQNLTIPKACPFVYRFDKISSDNGSSDLKPRPPGEDDLTLGESTSGIFLDKPGRLKELIRLQEMWKNSLPVASEELDKSRREATLEESLLQLRKEQNLMRSLETITNQPSNEASPVETERWTDDPCEFEEYDFFAVAHGQDHEKVQATVVPVPQRKNSKSQDGPIVVLIRHGRTPHNNLGLFTGWEDPPLADDGVDDARNAGKLLRRHGFEFDVVYTSWLTRAIQTAYYVLDELDSIWLPIIKSWRLNERMYGALTGKSKKMVANEYGEEQLKKWRRGYTIRPPPTSSYSLSYPGNDERRAKHFQDLPISWKESFFRTIEQRKLVVHRKFPKTESLKDCMDRSIPFYTKCIREEAVNKGKRVLITSHENAIRGILMHLCDIPEEAMNQLHLPNGLPLVYNVKGRCISLLDDGSGRDPMDVHDFGPAAKYLFKPCEITDDFYDSMAQQDKNGKSSSTLRP